VELVLGPITLLDIKDRPTITEYRIVTLQTDQTPLSAALLCNCLIQCPLTLLMPTDTVDQELNFTLDDAIKETKRIKHNRGFWIYFILRILASGSLATSFSM
jgi:hypothetical protein